MDVEDTELAETICKVPAQDTRLNQRASDIANVGHVYAWFNNMTQLDVTRLSTNCT